MYAPSHPGELVAEELEELRISIRQAADDLGVSRQSLSGIVNGRKSITPEMAVRLGHYFGNGPGLWLRMQAQHDLWRAQQAMRPQLRRIPRARAGV